MPSLSNNVDILVKTSADNSGVVSAEQELGNLDRAVQTSHGIGQFFTENMAQASVAATGILASIGLVTKGAIDQAASYQQNRIAFETMLGSADKAKTLLAQMSDFAAKTPFQLPDVVEGGKNLLAFGVNMKDIIPTFTTLGNIAAGVGTDKLPNLINVFGQVKSAGRLMSQDLLQFTSMGIPIIDLLAQHYGTTSSKVRDLVQTGKVGFGDLQSSLELLGGPSGKWGDLMAKQSTTFSGTMSNVSDQMGRVLRQAVGIGPDGDVRAGSLFDVMIKGANSLLGAMSAAAPAVDRLSSFFEHNKSAVSALLGAMAGLVAIIGITLISAFGGAIAIVAGFMIVGAALGALWTSHRTLFMIVAGAITGAFIPALLALGSTLLFTVVPAFIAAAIPMLPFIAIGAAVAGIAYLIINNWTAIKSFFANLWQAVSGFFMSHWQIILSIIFPFLALPLAVISNWGAISGFFGRLWGSVSGALGGFFNGIVGWASNTVNTVVSFFAGLPGRIVGAIGNISSKIAGDIKGAFHSLHIPGFATGVRNFQGGLAVVGEQGPELVSLPQGANVYTNGESKRMGSNTTVHIGQVVLASAAAVTQFFNQLDQDTINLGRGLTPARGLNG